MIINDNLNKLVSLYLYSSRVISWISLEDKLEGREEREEREGRGRGEGGEREREGRGRGKGEGGEGGEGGSRYLGINVYHFPITFVLE